MAQVISASADPSTPHEFRADRLITRLLGTSDSWPLALLRLTAGIVMFPHGAQKLLGWFGGHGFSGTMGFFTGTLGLPAAIAFLVIIAEFFGAIGLIVGALTRIAALGIFAVMVGAVAMAHYEHGFFMNWYGSQAGEGFEYHLLVLGMMAALIIGGAGAQSLDRTLSNKIARPEP